MGVDPSFVTARRSRENSGAMGGGNDPDEPPELIDISPTKEVSPFVSGRRPRKNSNTLIDMIASVTPNPTPQELMSHLEKRLPTEQADFIERKLPPVDQSIRISDRGPSPVPAVELGESCCILSCSCCVVQGRR